MIPHTLLTNPGYRTGRTTAWMETSFSLGDFKRMSNAPGATLGGRKGQPTSQSPGESRQRCLVGQKLRSKLWCRNAEAPAGHLRENLNTMDKLGHNNAGLQAGHLKENLNIMVKQRYRNAGAQAGRAKAAREWKRDRILGRMTGRTTCHLRGGARSSIGRPQGNPCAEQQGFFWLHV